MRIKLLICILMTVVIYGCSNTEISDSTEIIENNVVENDVIAKDVVIQNNIKENEQDEEVDESKEQFDKMNENLTMLLSSNWTDASSSEYLLYFDVDKKLILTGSRDGAIISSYVYDNIELIVGENAFTFHIAKIDNSSDSETENSTSAQETDIICKFLLEGNEVELIYDYYSNSPIISEWMLDD